MTSEIKEKTYNSVSDEIDALNLKRKEKVISFLLALLSALLVIAGPIAVCINLLIFTNFMVLFAFFIALLVIGGLLIGDIIYLHLLARGRVLGLYHIWAVDILVLSSVVFVVFLFIVKIFF